MDSSKTAVEGEGGATTSTASESRESAKEKELPSKEKEVKPSQERGGQEGVVPQEREEREGVVSQEREGQGVSLLGEGERHEAKSSHTEEEHSSDQIVPS